MTTQEFQKLVKERVAACERTLGRKASEYARGDRLSNFKKAAGVLGATPEAACLGFWMKHVVSIVDLVQDIEQGKLAPRALWDEKIGDAVNYLILLEGLVRERARVSEKP